MPPQPLGPVHTCASLGLCPLRSSQITPRVVLTVSVTPAVRQQSRQPLADIYLTHSLKSSDIVSLLSFSWESPHKSSLMYVESIIFQSLPF